MTLAEAKTELGKLIVNMEDAAWLIVQCANGPIGARRDAMFNIRTGLETAARNARKIMEGS